MKAFGRGDVLIEGPYYLNTEICGVRFVHPYYVSSKDPLYVAGYDLITKAKLVIDSSNRCVWSYYTSTRKGCLLVVLLLQQSMQACIALLLL